MPLFPIPWQVLCLLHFVQLSGQSVLRKKWKCNGAKPKPPQKVIYPRLQNPVVEEPTFTHPNTHTSTHTQDTAGGERVVVGRWESGGGRWELGERAESRGEGRGREEGRDRQKQNTTLVLYSCQLAVSGHKLVGNVETRKIMSENLTKRCRYGGGGGGIPIFQPYSW